MLTFEELSVQLKLKAQYVVHGTLVEISRMNLPEIKGQVMLAIVQRPAQCPAVERKPTKARTVRIPAGTTGLCCQKDYGHKGRHVHPSGSWGK